MTQVERLTRPRTREEAVPYYSDLSSALERLGVDPGDEFMLAAVTPTPAVEENAVGPHVAGSTTSRKAAVANYPRSGTQRWRVLGFILRSGDTGITRDQIEAQMQTSGNTVRPRVAELIEGGWAEATDRTRPTRGGQQAEVLIATEKARKQDRERLKP